MNEVTDCRCVKKDLIKGILDQEEIDECIHGMKLKICVRSVAFGDPLTFVATASF